jgi:hypothetical protein
MVGLAVSTAASQNASNQGLMFSQCGYIPFTNSTFDLCFIQPLNQLFRSCNHKNKKWKLESYVWEILIRLL